MTALEKAALAMFIAEGNWENLWPSLKDSARYSYLRKAQAAFSVFESELLTKLEDIIRNDDTDSLDLHSNRGKIILDISYDSGGIEKFVGSTLKEVLQKATAEDAEKT